MELVKRLLDVFGGITKIAAWFISTIVIPVTIWFVALRADVHALQGKHQDAVVEMTTFKAAYAVDKKELDGKLTEISRSLGRIEGQLQRIK